MLEFEKWVARVLLLNSALALAVSLGLLGQRLDGDGALLVFGAALLGFLAAVFSLKRRQIGLWGGLLYYALQVFSYFPLDDGREFSVKAGVSIGLVLRFHSGVVVLNVIALTLLLATAAVLLWRRRTPAFI
jgi:ABC-type multidrug transport system permease subunit